MGDHKAATLAKAKKELEELYLGVPDDSVNLTFQDLAQVIEKKKTLSPSNTNVSTMEKSQSSSSLAKLPSIDFNKSIQAASFQSSGTNNNHNYSHHQMINNHHNDNMPHNHHWPEEGGELWPGPRGGPHHAYGGHDHHHHHGHASSHHHHVDHGHHAGAGSSLHVVGGGDHHDQRSMHVYDDDMMSHVSGMSVAYGGLERGGRRRPGIPHSNICTVCSNYIYICRHRCLVCGRVYCRQCVSIGMGEMTEGRKCVECLGRRFNQRYIHRAGNMGWCMGYRSAMKQQELKWAEKGPRRSGENRYRGGGGNNSVMATASRSRSPVGPATPRSSRNAMNTPNSFVMSSPYSPYSPANNHHPMPF